MNAYQNSIPVVWLSLHQPDIINRGYWDQGFIEDIFSGRMWYPPKFYTFTHHNGIPDGAKGAIVVIASRHHAEDLKKINGMLAKLDWCLVMLTGDEESKFPWRSLRHKNMKVYAMSPHPDFHEGVDGHMVNGYPPQVKLLSKYRKEFLDKPMDWFFSGQMGHKRREQAKESSANIPNGEFNATGGFTQGMDHDAYYKKLASAKFALCPSGPQTPDTFRIYEALEAGCIPIADSQPSRQYPGNFWFNLFGEQPPFPVIEQWESLPFLLEELMPKWKHEANKIGAWWQRYKRNHVYQMAKDIYQLSANSGEVSSEVTALVPSSPIRSHPDTGMINDTIKSIKDRLDLSEIIVTVDGIREEQEDRREDYEEYTRRLLWDCNWGLSNVLPIFFDQHSHQSLMSKTAITEVNTPYLLYVEHDTPLVGEIDFAHCIANLQTYNLIRFSHEAVIPEPHIPMMLDTDEQMIKVRGFIRTVQWSQRPHITRTEFYRWILNEYFEWGKRAFIEHKMYGVILADYEAMGYFGWEKFAMALYAPDPKDLRRSANLNGRGDDPFYESEL